MDTSLETQVIEALKGVVDPELRCNIVDLGMVRAVTVEKGSAAIKIALTTLGCPLRSQIENDTKAMVALIDGIDRVEITFGEMDKESKAATMTLARSKSAGTIPTSVPPHTAVVGIASGKGGVGKSTVTANLATAMAHQGMKVGLIDADIAGFSLTHLLGIKSRLEAKSKQEPDSKPLIAPHVIEVGSGKIETVSMGLLSENSQEALMWRGLIAGRAVQHFSQDVAWNEDLNLILIDLPPGTGDVPMMVARLFPNATIYVVTTPSSLAQLVAARAISLARKSNLRVAGVIENMSYYIDEDGRTHHIFGKGGGASLAETNGLDLLAQIPITNHLGDVSSAGSSPIGYDPDSAYSHLAKTIAETAAASTGNEIEGCSSRLLQRIEDSLGSTLDATER